jgi:hypothetical protein
MRPVIGGLKKRRRPKRKELIMHTKTTRFKEGFRVASNWSKVSLFPNRLAVPALLILPILILTITGCGSNRNYSNPDKGSKEHPLLAIRVTPNSVPAMAVAATTQLSAGAGYGGYPGGISYQDVTGFATWATSDRAVATVNNGLVTGTGNGSAKISAVFGGKSGSMTVFVGIPQYITITPAGPFSLSATPETDFFATQTFADGSTLDVSGPATWTATPDGVIDIYPYLGGQAKLVAPGTATVTATLDSGMSGSVEVTVVP